MPPEKPKKAKKATAATVARRTDDILRIRLDGAEFWDTREYVRAKEVEEGSAWKLEPGESPMSDSNLWRYVARADKIMEEATSRSRKKLLRQHAAKRRNLYAKAILSADYRTGLACLRDEAELLGLIPARSTSSAAPGASRSRPRCPMTLPNSSPPPASSPPSSAPPWTDPRSIEARVQRYIRTVRRNPWIPCAPSDKQALFLMHDDTEEALFGGAASGGKSQALLMAAAQYVDVPGYAALLLRRTYSDLALPGALMDRAMEWWGGKAHWSGQDKTFTFPSGARIGFGYLETDRDKLRYQGSELQFVAFDELTQFPEPSYRYLFSRLRKPTTGPLAEVPLRMRAATNPGGPGHAWMKARFIPDAYLRAKSADRFAKCWWNEDRLFVPARMDDNTHIDQVAYRRGLRKLDPVTRAQLEDGDMKAHTGGRFQEQWFRSFRDMVDAYHLLPQGDVVPKGNCPIVVSVDPAGGTSDGADYTAIEVAAVTPWKDLLMLDVVREHIAIEGIVPRLAAVCRQWRPSYALFEGGFMQAALIRQARATEGIPVVREVSPEGKAKLFRAIPAIIMAENGQIYLPERPPHWQEAFLAELCGFTGNEREDAHDDMVDALAYLAMDLERYGGSGAQPVIFSYGRGR